MIIILHTSLLKLLMLLRKLASQLWPFLHIAVTNYNLQMSAAMAPSNSYITLSVISLWFLSAQAYYRLIPAENIPSGFSKTGIQPLNHPVFHDDEFLPSTLPTGINSVVANQVSTASPSVLSLPSVSNKPLERTEACTTHNTYLNSRKG